MQHLRILDHDIYLGREGDPIVLKPGVLDRVYQLYSSDGGNFTQKMVADSVELSIDVLKAVLTADKITKKCPPHSPTSLKNIPIDTLVESTLRRKTKQFNQKLKHAKLEKAYRASMEIDAIIEEFRDILLQVSSIEVEPVERIHSFDSFDAGVLVLADWHVGRLADEGTHGKVGYSSEVFKSRIGQLCTQLEEHFLYHEYKKLDVAILGDLLDAPLCNMHSGQSQDAKGVEQFKLASWGLEQVLTVCLRFFPNVDAYCVAGNHDRFTAKKQEDASRLAFQLLIQYVQERMSKTGVTFHSSSARTAAYTACEGIRVILNHGDERGVTAGKLVTADSIYHTGYRVILRGHTHTRKLEEGNGYLELTCPSVCGPSSYSQNMLSAFSRPGQMLVSLSSGPLRVLSHWLDL